MTTTTEPRLTPKQQEVLAMLHKGMKPQEIAKKLKITNSGVYGHMRQMRKAGVQLPGEQLADSRVSPNGTANTPREPVEPHGFDADAGAVDALEVALKSCKDSIAAIDAEIEQLDARRAELAKAKQRDEDAAEHYTAALVALDMLLS